MPTCILAATLALLQPTFPAPASPAPASPAPASVPAPPPTPRHAIEHALPFLEREGTAWMRERGCASCHHVPFSLWSRQEARLRGFDVDENAFEAHTNEALVSVLSRPKDGGGVDTISQMLLGRDRASAWRAKPSRHFKTSDPYETLWEMLLDRQADDGSWPPEGQLTTPPEITTGWALLALASRADTDGDPGAGLHPDRDLAPPLDAQIASSEARLPAARKRALGYLRDVEPHPTNEALLLRALRERLFEERTDGPAWRALLARQNPDGGWSNLADPSANLDASAKLDAGWAPEHPVVARARAFLLRTQREDGTWLVPADRIREGPRRGSVDDVFTYWGTAWATIGLLRTLPDG